MNRAALIARAALLSDLHQWWVRHMDGESFRDIAAGAGVTRQNVGRAVRNIQRRLDAWPSPNTWQATLPERLRELCLARASKKRPQGIDTPEALQWFLARDSRRGFLSTDHWTPADIAEARQYTTGDE